jgi:flagellar basal-body rod protein FlgG
MTAVSTALNIARTGLQLQEMQVAIKSQNLASQGVDGYKRQYLVAFDLPYTDLDAVGAATSSTGTVNTTGLQMGMGVKPAGIYRSFQNGDLVKTDGDLDMAIQGDGFFKVSMPDGTTAYTRAGAFTLNPQGQITTIYGHTVSPGITIPNTAKSITINEEGQVSINNGATEVIVGQFDLATFVNPSGLKAMGDSLFMETAASGAADAGTPGTARRGMIKQGWREQSNVNAVEEITDLIKVQRAYEMLTKVLNAGDTMMQAANSIGR